MNGKSARQRNCIGRGKNTARRLVLFAAAVTLFASCATTRSFRDVVERIPAKNYRNYPFSPSSKIIDRLDVSSEMVLNFLRKIDNNDLYTLYELSEKEKALLEQYIGLLPSSYRDVLQKRLLGIYFINGFLGSGMADYVISESGDIYAVLFLNPEVLKRTLSELVTYKENTCYRQKDDHIQLKIEISNQYSGLLYILMHECTHIYDYVNRITPFVEPNMRDLQEEKQGPSPFTDEYWRGYTSFKKKTHASYKNRIHFYAQEDDQKIDKSELPAIYSELKGTPFASLYSYSNWAEDFAEFATFYYFTKKLNMDYAVKIYRNGNAVYEYRPLGNPAVLERSRLLPDIFGEVQDEG